MSKDPHEVFEAYLKETEGRYTKSKKEITSEVFNLSEHFEIENFIDHLRSKTKSISRATVYRTVKQLLDAGLLQKINGPNGKVFYEQSRPQKEHAHIICNECGKITAMNEKKLRNIINDYCKNIQFKPQYQSIHIYGECEDKENCPNLNP